jgi:tRNA (cytosine40_48-C5)-methyltransferase
MNFLKRYTEIGHNIIPEELILKRSIRVNTLKITEHDLVSRLTKKNILLEKIQFIDFGYYTESEFSLGATPEYLQGYYFLQEAASQLPVQILDPQPSDLILDMCAAPGAKTTQLAQYTKNQAKIIALDIKTKRLEALRNNLARLGASNAILYNKDARYIADFGIVFDRILLDAPCSGNFMIEKGWLEKRTLEDIEEKAALQKQLIKAAISVLKPGGILVYSTCSLEPEEDEEVIEWALKNHDVSIETISSKIGTLTNSMLKLWPEQTKTQGFFIAKLKKNI